MKRILITLCTLAFVVAGCTSAPIVEDASAPCYKPVSVEEYPYGSFDEPRINMTYQLSLSDDPRLIPTEDFERGGRRYFLLDFTLEETDAESGVVTYTVTFGSKKLPYGVNSLGGTRTAQVEAYADPVGQKSMLIVAVVMLALAVAAMRESKNQSDHPVASEDEDEFFSPLYEDRKKSS